MNPIDEMNKHMELGYFQALIGRAVKISELGITGYISGIWITLKGMEYQVKYFWDGEIKECYLSDDRIVISIVKET